MQAEASTGLALRGRCPRVRPMLAMGVSESQMSATACQISHTRMQKTLVATPIYVLCDFSAYIVLLHRPRCVIVLLFLIRYSPQIVGNLFLWFI